MKKILISLSVIVAVAAVVFGITTAFFSDTETSTGNTFTAGSLDLKVDNTCHYNDGACPTDPQNPGMFTTWTENDLTPGIHKFLWFNDVKPGDSGEDTVSLHVIANDACARFRITPNVDNDMSCPEPEAATGDSTCGLGLNGELDDYLIFRVWVDDGDNVYEGEQTLTYCGHAGLPGPEWCYLSDIDPVGETWPLGVLTGSTTYYFGLEWQLPSGTGNIVQSDSWAADMAFDVIQYRNNLSCTWTP